MDTTRWLFQVCLICALSSYCLEIVSAASAAGSRRHGLEDEIGRYIGVDCSKNGMKVSLDYNLSRHRATMTSSLAVRLERCTVNLGSRDGCDSTNDSADKRHSVYTSYSQCGVSQKNTSYGSNYSAKVIVNAEPSMTPTSATIFMFDVSCTLLNEQLTKTRFELLRDYRRMDTSRDVLETPMNSQIVMEIQPLFAILSGVKDLYTYPSKCWMASLSSPANRVVVLDKGCPVRKGALSLSSIYQVEALQYTASSTKIYVNTARDVLPIENSNLSDPIVKMSFHCDVLFCTSNADHRILDVPMCPSAAPCDSTVSSVQPSLVAGRGGGASPSSLPRTVVASLPLPIHVDVTRDGGRPPLTDSVKQPDAPLKEVKAPPPPSVFLSPLGAVFVFAAGLLVGCLCTSAACLRRYRTQPLVKRCPGMPSASVSQSDRADASADSKLLVTGGASS